MKSKPITEATRAAVLEAAWELIVDEGRADVGQKEIAARAGVSRQTVYYAFGDRTGLLLELVRHKDTLSDHVERITAARRAEGATVEAMLALVDAWLDYVPVIYPVGILLDAASLSDPAAEAAWRDRMEAVRGAFLARARDLSDDPERVADEIWALCHPTQWRRLVVERGWSAEAFGASRRKLVRAVLEPSP